MSDLRPHAVEGIEQALITLCLLLPHHFLDIRNMTPCGYFSTRRHQDAWDALTHLCRDGATKPIAPLDVENFLMQRGYGEGIAKYLQELIDSADLTDKSPQTKREA